ncbi:MAG: cysteine--tRNA ligase [Candidatus Paceibacterota bacterium]
MALKLYNTLSGVKEVFTPIKGKDVNFFVCGPTVYDLSHLGHARTYIILDTIVKYLKEVGFKVFYLQNITDIDDKIIGRAKEKKITPEALARNYEEKYFKDVKSLKIDSVKKYARATEHIKEIVSQVRRLLEKDYAYKINDGIYYDISKFKEYGKLSKRTVLQAEDAVSRIDNSEGKRNRGDFCLWKFSKPDEPKWDSPWGPGRPGWHIEDTAITEKYFGAQYDIHGGARDLIFPHHEAEIAQMEAISGRFPLVKYWLHTGFLTVNGQKMSKSLGNFITIEDFLKNNSIRLLRFLVIKNYYRSPLDYSEGMLLQARKELLEISDFVAKLERQSHKPNKIVSNKSEIELRDRFTEAIEDDFNTPKAVAAIFSVIRRTDSLLLEGKLSSAEAKSILSFLKKIDKFLNFVFDKKPKISKGTIRLVKERNEYRKRKMWDDADKKRREAEEKESDTKIIDTSSGTMIMRNIDEGPTGPTGTATVDIPEK